MSEETPHAIDSRPESVVSSLKARVMISMLCFPDLGLMRPRTEGYSLLGYRQAWTVKEVVGMVYRIELVFLRCCYCLLN